VIATALAPAKVNLYLHVGPRRPDGFHPVSSLMVFADVGDRLTLEPAEEFGLDVRGPHAGEVPADESNLVLKAARRLLRNLSLEPPRARLVLDKQLPVAAGLGGGSSDAAAALKLLRDHLGVGLPDAELETLAAELGSDVPACIRARAVIGEGRGERLRDAPALPALPAVLLDTGVASSTPAVYRAYDAMGAAGEARGPELGDVTTVPALAAALAATRNDLEPPAIALEPRIGEALDLVRAQPEALFARMSGSGSSCFALCADDDAARRLAGRLSGARVCRLR
jgi:4-diphosphocytidyl-2-C-methyl-D-erythritol kinase